MIPPPDNTARPSAAANATTTISNATRAAESLPVRSAHTIPEGCLLLGGVSPATIYRWHDKGLIKLVKIGGRTLVPASEITRLTSTAA